jgi:chromosome partitioning protein
VVAVTNQKGGVGKTTTAINLAASWAAGGDSVLLIDLDPQGNSGSGLGIHLADSEATVYHALLGEARLDELIRKTAIPQLDLAPANTDLTGAEIELVTALARETRLQRALAPVRDRYSLILIDCPPSLGILTVNALTAASGVLIPLQCEYYALEGLSHLLHTIELIRESLNSQLQVDGILLTMFDARNNLSHQVLMDVREHFPDKVYNTVIPRNVRLSEAPSHGQPAILYDVASRGAQAYLALAAEMRSRLAPKPDMPSSSRTHASSTDASEAV